jgi:acyl-coenzyme A thioesterase PaaI-like protein
MVLANPPALQDIWPNATCCGCGPANPIGLHIKSYWSEDGKEVICTFQPRREHNSGLTNTTYGGLLASLCDCHSAWTAMAALYRAENREHGSDPAISCVTAILNVTFMAPTPLDQPIVLRAHVEEISTSGRKVTVYCGVYSVEKKTAEARVIAVRVRDDKSRGAQHGAI